MTERRVWNVELVEWAESMAGLPFVWGATDCGTLLRGAWELLGNTDVLPDLSWTTTKEAQSVTADGLASILSGIADEIGLRFATSGDAIVTEADGLPAIQIVVTPRTVLAVVEDGTVHLRPIVRPDGATAWRFRRG